MTTLSIRRMYYKPLGKHPKIPWRKVLCKTPWTPKCLFIHFLALHEKLYTRDRLIKWGMQVIPECPQCDTNLESIDHLFFQCPASKGIWSKLLNWLGILWPTWLWTEEVQWCVIWKKSKGNMATIYIITLAAVVYEIWLDRNHKIFNQQRKPEDYIVKKITQKC